MTKFKKMISVCSAFLILAIGSSSYALITDTFDISNFLQFDTIRFTIEEKTDKGKTEFRLPDTILPTQKIAYVPAITNNGAECWMRMQITASIHNMQIDPGAGFEIEGLDKDWIRADDGFYYLHSALDEDQTIYPFDGIRIIDWNDSHQGQDLTIEMRFEAVQQRNFSPDYTVKDPWHGIKAEAAQNVRLEGGSAE